MSVMTGIKLYLKNINFDKKYQYNLIITPPVPTSVY